MKIEKLGKVVPQWAGKWKCSICNCAWIMESGDDRPEIFENHGGETGHRMRCPTCGASAFRMIAPSRQEEAKK